MPSNRADIAIEAGLLMALRTLNDRRQSEADSTPQLPNIGPMYDGITIADRIQDLPFSHANVAEVVKEIDDAIATETRLHGTVTIAAQVLLTVRNLIPLIGSL